MTAPDNLTAALAKVQEKLPTVHKNRTANTGTFSYKYADLNDVASAIHPLLGAVGLAFIARPTLDEDGRFVLAYELRHVSGESTGGQYPLPDPTKAKPQEIGSALTYARRYTLCSVTGVVPDEDDDGAAANNTTAKKAERIKRPATPPVDEWTAPEGVVPPTPPSNKKTDEKWFDDWLQRVVHCESLPVLKGLWSECTEQHRIGKLTDADFSQATEAKNTTKAAIERADAPSWPEVKQPPDAAA